VKIARFLSSDGKKRIGVVRGPNLVDVTDFVSTISKRLGVPAPHEAASLVSWIEAGWLQTSAVEGIDRLVNELQAGLAPLAVENVRLLAPVDRPGQIFGLARNFPAHAREGGVEPPPFPVYFGKAITSVIGPGDPIVYHEGLTRVDPEAEIALVVREGGFRIPVEKAEAHIAGYTCFNDVTARQMQLDDFANSWPWLRSKGMDTFGPMGPWMVTSNEMPLPIAAEVECRVNGEVRQKDNTANLEFNPAVVLSYISHNHTLRPGDVISLGTPKGMQPMFPGDVVEVTVGGIGTLRNPIVGDEHTSCQ